MGKLTNSMSSTGKLLTQMQLNNIHQGECNTSVYGSIWMRMWYVCVRREWWSVCRKEKQERQGQRVRLTKSECDSICSLSHEMVLVSLGRAKIYLCQPALHSPCLRHSKCTILQKKARSPTSLHIVEQNAPLCSSFCWTSFVYPCGQSL